MSFYITFRIDDVFPKMNWRSFELLYELFSKYKIYPLLGVIPDNRDVSLNEGDTNSQFWERLRKLNNEGWVMAQHGHTHVYCNQNSGILGINPCSEFAGLSYEEQVHKIELGKKILQGQGLDAIVWMAPAHSFDDNTLKALNNCGFKYVSDGYSLFPYVRNSLKFIPCQFSFPRRLFFCGVGTVCIHPRTMSSDYIKKLDNFIAEHRKLCINYVDAMNTKPVNGYIVSNMVEKFYLDLGKLVRVFKLR